MNINPLPFYIEALRYLMAPGQLPTLLFCLLAAVEALVVFVTGYNLFQYVRPGFGAFSNEPWL